ncbi:MAG: TonB-dependent receptor plug domain-containing protein, partial [Candidatus Binatia bacterium]
MKKVYWAFLALLLLSNVIFLTARTEADELPENSQPGDPAQPSGPSPTPSSPDRAVPTFTAPEVIVTATKTAEPVTQTTVSADVITGEQIQERQQTDVLQLLRDVPGLTIVQTGSRGGTTSLFTRGGESDYNMVLIDGVKVNNAGGFYNYSDLTSLDVGRIEIVRGPHSALYGSDAISSVIQVFTPRGEGPLHGALRFRGGNYDTFEEQVQVGGGTDRYGYSLSVGRIDSEGILRTNNDYSNTTVASRFDWDGIPDLQLTTTLRYIDSRFHFPTGSAGDRFDPFDPRQYQDSRRLVIGPRLVHQTLPWWQQTLQLGYFNQWSTFRDPFDEPHDFGAFTGNNDEYRLSADYTSTFFLPAVFQITPTVTVGGYGELEHLEQKSNSRGSVTRVDPSRNAQSFYTQLQLEWQEQFFVTSGFRLDDGSVYGTHVNPRVSAAYILPKIKTKLRGGYGEGLKAPSFVENFGTGSQFAIGNPDLKPEESTSWEVGLDQPWTVGTLTGAFSVTYFLADYENLVAFVSGRTPNFFNIQSADAKGLEVGLRTFLTEELSIGATYTYLKTKVIDAGPSGGTLFVEGKSLLRRPQNTGAFTANYTHDRLTANFALTLKDASVDRDFFINSSGQRVRLSGYVKGDLALSYRLFENRWG